MSVCRGGNFSTVGSRPNSNERNGSHLESDPLSGCASLQGLSRRRKSPNHPCKHERAWTETLTCGAAVWSYGGHECSRYAVLAGFPGPWHRGDFYANVCLRCLGGRVVRERKDLACSSLLAEWLGPTLIRLLWATIQFA